MKKLSIILSLLLLVSLVIVAFGYAAEEPEVEVVLEGPPEGPIPREEVSVDASYDGKEIEITTGNALIVTLESNDTTGFKRELTELTNQPEEPAPWEEAEESRPEPEQEGPEPTKPAVYTGGLPEKTVLKHVDNKYVPPEAEGVVGATGKEVWTFHAEEKGKSTLSIEYRRPWEQGVEPANTFTLTVVVK